MTVAEGILAATSLYGRPMLQWGRNLTVAEGAMRSANSALATGFNGAAT